MAAAAGEALGGMDLTSLFVNVVPSFAGMSELMKGGGEQSAGEFSSAFGEAAKPFGEMGGAMAEGTNLFAKIGGEAAGAFVGAFGSLMKGQLPDLMAPFNIAEGAVDEFVHNSIGKIPLLGGAFDKVFDGMMGTLDAFKGPAGEFMNQILEIGEKWQERARTIAGTTDLGSMPELLRITKELGAEGLPNLDSVVGSIGALHNRLQGLSSEQLKDMSRTLAQFSELAGGVKISTEALTGTFNAFNVAPGQANEALTELGNTAKLTNVPINELLMQMERGDVGLSAFGFNIQQAGSMLVKLNEAGIQAPRMLQAFTTAAGKFIAKGLTPEEGFKDLVDTVKHDLSIGTADAAQDAMKHLKDIFGAKNAELVFEGIKKNLIDLPSLIQPIAGINEGPEKALEATETLEERLKGVKTQLETALEPLGTALANKLTGAGTKLSEWIQTHQAKIVHYAGETITVILQAVKEAATIMGNIILAVAPTLNIIKDVAITMGKAILGTVESISAVARHLPGVGPTFAKVDDAAKEMMGTLTQIQGVDLTKGAREFGNAMEGAAGPISKMQKGIMDTTNAMEGQLSVADQMKQKVTDQQTGVESLKDAYQVTAEGQLQLVGSPEQIEATKQRMHQLGLDVTTGPDGVVTNVLAGNEKIKKDFEAWTKTISDKPVNVKTQLDPTAPRELTPDNLMDALGVPPANRFHSEGGILLPVRLTAVPNPEGMPGGAGLPMGMIGGGTVTLPGAGGGAPAGGAEAWRGTVTDVVMNAAQKYPGMNPQLWVDKLVKQIQTESGGDPNIVQKVWDINMAQGNPAKGLMQMIPQTFAAHNISGGQYMDPVAQLYAAIDYVIKQYGMDKAGGPNFIGQGHGYQLGGEVGGVFTGLLKGVMEGFGMPKEVEDLLGLTTKMGGTAKVKTTQSLSGFPAGGHGLPLAEGGHSLIAASHAITYHHEAAALGPHVGLEQASTSIFKHQDGGPGVAGQIITIVPWKLHALIGDKLGGAGLNQGMFSFGRQEGGDVPWMPGTQWGMDGVHAILAPGEHIWEEPAVRGAGGHGALARMRALAKAGKLNAAFSGLNLGGIQHLQGGTGSADYYASGAGDDLEGVDAEILGTSQIAHQYGLKLTAGKSGHGTHQKDGGYHDTGEAGDFSNGVQTAEELSFAIYMIQNYGQQLAEVIHSSPHLPKLVKDGKLVDPIFYGADTLAGHRDHVHIAVKRGNSPELESIAGPAGLQAGSGGPGGAAGVPGGGPGSLGVSGLGGRSGAGPMGLGLGGPGLGGPGGAMTPQQAEALAKMDEHLKKLKEKVDAANADLNKLLAEPAEEQALDKDKIDKARAKRDKLQGEYDEALQRRNEKQTSVNEADIKAAAKGAKGKAAGEGGEYEGMAQQLGGGIVKGLFQELGFPDVFGKAFTDWGIWKLAMGGLGYGAGLLERISGKGGGGLFGGAGGPGGTAEGLLGGGGGGGGLGGLQIPGISSLMGGDRGNVAGPAPGGPMAPGQAPGNVPFAAAPSSYGGPGVVINNDISGVMGASDIHATVNDSVVTGTRNTAGSGGQMQTVQPA